MLVTVEASVFVQLNCSKKYSCRSSTYHQFKAEYQNYHIYISSMQAILNQIIARKKRVHKYAPFKTESILSKIQTQDNTYEINITTKTKKQLFFNKANKLLDR